MPSSRVYVGGLSPKVQQSDLEALFGEYGRVTRCDFKARPESAFAFVEFETPKEAERAIKELDGHMLSGVRLLVESARNQYPTQGTVVGGQVRRQDCRVIVDELPPQASWQDLKDFAREGGNVVYADVYSDRGVKRGVVEFDTKSDAQKAVRRLDGRKMQGCEVLVREEIHVKRSPHPTRPSSPPRSRHRDRSEERRQDRPSEGRSGREDRSSSHRRDDDRNRVSDNRVRSSRRRSRSVSRSRSPVRLRGRSRSRSNSPRRRRSSVPRVEARRHNGVESSRD